MSTFLRCLEGWKRVVPMVTLWASTAPKTPVDEPGLLRTSSICKKVLPCDEFLFSQVELLVGLFFRCTLVHVIASRGIL